MYNIYACSFHDSLCDLFGKDVNCLELAVKVLVVFLLARISSSLRCSLSNRNLLVDSEASVSVFPAPASSSGSGIHLVTANGSTMTCSGSRIIPLLFSSKHFHWIIQLAPVSIPILGADFLRHHHLLVDVVEAIFEPSDPLPPGESLFTASESKDFPLRANLLSTPQAIKDLLHTFSYVVTPTGFRHQKPRRLNPVKLALPRGGC